MSKRRLAHYISGVTETGVGRSHGAGHRHGQDPGGDVLGPDHAEDTQDLDQTHVGGESGARATDVAAAAVAPAADRAGSQPGFHARI